jgi:hypothetical protein
MNGRKSEGQPPSKRANAGGPSPATPRSHSAAPSHRDTKANLNFAPRFWKIGRRFATVPQQQLVKPSKPAIISG